tara:strand:+ start:36 stop:731 length:696 start_codon:yes stop_codon:yes gene_type:complete
MTYSDWREDLTEGVKTRLLIKALKGAKKLSKKLGKKVKGSVENIGATKAGQGRNVFIKNPDGTRIQNPNVKPLTPDYQNLGQMNRGEGQLRLFNAKNPNYKLTNPTPKPEKITKSSSGPNRSAIRKKNEDAIKTAKALQIQQNKLKKQALDGMQINLLKKSDYPKKVQKYLGNDFERVTKMQEEIMAAPTNSVGGGQIAGTVEAGDNPPVKKKKRYIYGGTGSRKMWMNNK